MKKFIALGLLGLFIGGSAHAQQLRYNYTLATFVPYDWQETDPTYTNWIDSGDTYGCTNWSPATSTYGKGTSFTQTATDCKKDQERMVQNRQQDSRTGIYQNVGDPFKEARVITVSDSRGAIGILENWSSIDPVFTSWQNTDALYGCSEWSPDPSIYSANINFTQTSSTCKTDQSRERQEREEELYTSEIRNTGPAISEKQTLQDQNANRPYSVTLSQWQNVGELYACANWSPDPLTVGKDVAFEQSATDCKMNQSRTRVEKYIDHKTASTVNVPKANETRTLSNQGNSRDAKGTREDWIATDSIFGAWTNTPGMTQYSCSNWSPSPASRVSAGAFVQTATDCKTDQSRTRQDREIESNTKEVRNKGDVATEKQTITGQGATRNYTVALSPWINDGIIAGCSNWAPSPSTVTINQTFTQTATDCQQPQKRTRSESYIDHQSGAPVAVSGVTQNQSVVTTDTRSAIGTKETWAASSSVYSAWSNSSEISGCNAWGPSPASYNVRTQFTQTGTGCSVTQTRSRQDQEQETTTGAIRNKGALATETQTIGGQSTTRSYLMDFTGWSWNGDNYNCSGWSPDPSTVTIGTAFTQSASCSRNQTRAAAGYTLVNSAWAPDPAVPYRVETQVIGGQIIAQTATGTKETWVASTPVYSAWTNISEIAGCSAWSPSPANYTERSQFTQTGTGCSVTQSRTRQDQQRETTTGAVRNNGALATENQTAGGQSTTRSYLMDFNAWSDASGYYSCSAWTPDASTIASGQGFTQSANCYINQNRGAAGYTLVNGGWVADPGVPYRTETQAIYRATTQAATGTKVLDECPPVSSQNAFYLRVSQQADIPMARWNGQSIPNVSPRGTLSASYGGYYYYNTSMTANGMRGGQNYPICRRPL